MRYKEWLYKIISIFNGNIFKNTRKLQFKLFIDAYKVYNQSIVYIDNNNNNNNKNKPDLHNSRLCGFTDADGCFTCSIVDKVKYGGLVRLIYILS